jgi:hypothetical protein
MITSHPFSRSVLTYDWSFAADRDRMETTRHFDDQAPGAANPKSGRSAC